MYSEFGQSFSLSMSTAQLCASEKDSNPLQIDSTPTSQVPSLEADKDASRREGTTEAEGEESSPVLLPPSSSSSCSSEQVGVEDEKEEKKKDGSGNSVEVGVKEEKEMDRGKDVGDDGDDDGYHTPTSPRHRIPEARVCPPAPKKPAHLLYMKRKVRADQARRRVDDIEGEIGSFWSAELDDAAPRTKKARGEATNA
ncbi:cyclin-dependent protein kinase inhibitor SMR12 [Phoenix dactylifera]|uniref:Cyclin-dependent protein kinase inhibitor SMR12 n=1 Tax=Phoenix dactylifera TaxID=42345 RepID=A0A8B9A5L1_PHODC|nr:cyclin-dependent protein kinase inhibitor SMR12 [Phoenix dactylifera]